MQLANLLPIHEEWIPGSSKLFIFFGGIYGGLGLPPFEFFRISNILPSSKLFLRDMHQQWYQRGISLIGNDAYEVGGYLREAIWRSGVSEVYFVGNSMGGFAALLFSAMLQCGKVIAFSPQTFISPELRLQHQDDRWSSRIELLHQTRAASDIYDLKLWIEVRFPEIRANVYFSTLDELDTAHANHLAGLANIQMHSFPTGGHELVAKIRDDGLLPMIFA